jgi:hypothetical protein
MSRSQKHHKVSRNSNAVVRKLEGGSGIKEASNYTLKDLFVSAVAIRFGCDGDVSDED